jgi:hypothetical protein
MISFACREPFYPEIDRYENILVIDGLITDQAGPHLVKLTRSYAFDESFPVPEEGAVVMILDQDEAIHEFTEDQPGVYRSGPSLKGVAGSSYKLVVSTKELETFESEWVLLKDVPGIDSITHVLEEHPTSDPDHSVFGMQIKVNSHDDSDQTRYYRWEWSETWEIITPITSSFYPDEARCWQTAVSSVISIGTSEHLTRDVINDLSIHFVSTETNKLRIKYSILVKQYSLSREAYSYWKNLQDITQNTGTLFDPTPAMVTGNITSITNPDVPVLGIFQASAVKQERVFIDRSEIPKSIDIPSGYSSCSFFDVTDSAEIVYYSTHGFPLAEIYTLAEVEHYIFTNSEMCFRCTLSGSNNKPDYWPEQR